MCLSLWGLASEGFDTGQAAEVARKVGETVAPFLPHPWDIIIQGILTLLSGIFALFSRKHAKESMDRNRGS